MQTSLLRAASAAIRASAIALCAGTSSRRLNTNSRAISNPLRFTGVLHNGQTGFMLVLVQSKMQLA